MFLICYMSANTDSPERDLCNFFFFWGGGGGAKKIRFYKLYIYF
jgi:hypothetical protein